MELKVEAAQRLTGKVAIVTGGGGTNSIGRSICIRYRRRGSQGSRRRHRRSERRRGG